MSKRPSPVNRFRPTRDLTNLDPTQLPPADRQKEKVGIQLDRRKFENGQDLEAGSATIFENLTVGGSITINNIFAGTANLTGQLVVAVSGTPFDPASGFLANVGPAIRVINTQNPSGGMNRFQFRDPASWEFGIFDESCPFDVATVTAAVSGRGNCLYWNDLRQGTNFLDQNRMRLDGDGQLTLRTANANLTAVENNLRLVHTPIQGRIASGGIGVGIQFGGLNHDFGAINAVGSLVDASGGLLISRFDFYTYGNGATTNSMTVSGDGTLFLPGTLSVGTASRLHGTVNTGTLTAAAATVNSLFTSGTITASGTITTADRVRALGLYTPILAPVVSFTPTVTGADTAELEVPYHPKDGITVLNFNTRRISWRCAASGSTSGSITIQKSLAASTGVFTPVTVGSLTLAAGAYQASTTTSLVSVASGDKIRLLVNVLPAAASWTVQLALESSDAPPP